MGVLRDLDGDRLVDKKQKENKKMKLDNGKITPRCISCYFFQRPVT